MNFHELKDSQFLFYGVDNLLFKLDDTIWRVEEDESDGYRSMLGTVEESSGKDHIFFREPLAIVKVLDDPDGEGWLLYDEENDHSWLRFGTDNAEDYYPRFYFNYTPMDPAKQKEPAKPAPKLKKLQTHVIQPFDRLFDQREH